VFLLFVVLTFLGESFAGSGLFMLPLVEETVIFMLTIVFTKKTKNIYIYIDIYTKKKMHYYKCPKLNNRVKLMLMNKGV
jgi:hypothetical protein